MKWFVLGGVPAMVLAVVQAGVMATGQPSMWTSPELIAAEHVGMAAFIVWNLKATISQGKRIAHIEGLLERRQKPR